MEHNTDLWSCPYNDEKYGEEQGSSFKYFKEFLKCPKPRSLVDFHKHLSNILSNMGRKRLPTYDTIREYSAKWKWFMRAEAYDKYIQDVEDEEMRQTIRDIRNNAIQAMNDRIKFQNNLRLQIEQDTTMTTNQKVYGANKNSEALKNEITSFNELINEGRTKLDADIDAELQGETQLNINGRVSLEDRLQKYETYFREVNSEADEYTS